MGTPTKKRTSGQRKRRASHFALKRTSLIKVSETQRVPHRYVRAHRTATATTGSRKRSTT